MVAMLTPPAAASLSLARVLTLGPVVETVGAVGICERCSTMLLIGFVRSVKKLEFIATLVSTIDPLVLVVNKDCVCVTGAVSVVFAEPIVTVDIGCVCGAFAATVDTPDIS